MSGFYVVHRAGYAEHHQQRHGGGLLIHAHFDVRAVENEPDDVVAREVALVPLSQSALIFRHTRLTTDLLIAGPPNTAPSARPTRRVFVRR